VKVSEEGGGRGTTAIFGESNNLFKKIEIRSLSWKEEKRLERKLKKRHGSASARGGAGGKTASNVLHTNVSLSLFETGGKNRSTEEVRRGGRRWRDKKKKKLRGRTNTFSREKITPV